MWVSKSKFEALVSEREHSVTGLNERLQVMWSYYNAELVGKTIDELSDE